MSRRGLPPLAAAVAAALFAVAFVTSLVPWLTRERTFVAATPTNMPRFSATDVRLRPGALLCVRELAFDATASGLRLVVSDVAQAGSAQPLRVEVSAEGYRSVAKLAGGYRFGIPVVVPLSPPPRDVDGAHACIRNEGRRTIALVGTSESRELSHVSVRRDGRPIDAQPWLQFVQRSSASILERPAMILERVAAFRPFPAVPPLLGLLALLVMIGVPLAVVGALALAERSDSEDRP